MSEVLGWSFILFVLAQRVLELLLANLHEKKLKNLGAVEIDNSGYRFIVGMHAAFFVSIILEKTEFHRPLSSFWMILLCIFFAAQTLRYWAIRSLGIYWNTKILVAPSHQALRKGPYKFLRHPNYIAVIIEIAVIPLILSCYITSVVFTIVNAFVIARRIRIEVVSLAVQAVKKEAGRNSFS